MIASGRKSISRIWKSDTVAACSATHPARRTIRTRVRPTGSSSSRISRRGRSAGVDMAIQPLTATKLTRGESSVAPAPALRAAAGREHVAGAAHGADQAGQAEVGIELAPQIADMDIDAAIGGRPIPARGDVGQLA